MGQRTDREERLVLNEVEMGVEEMDSKSVAICNKINDFAFQIFRTMNYPYSIIEQQKLHEKQQTIVLFVSFPVKKRLSGRSQ